MSDPVKDGGPAFPQHDLSGYGMGPIESDHKFFVAGMSLRDWFAGKALGNLAEHHNGSAMDPKALAKASYRFADAMIKARGEAQ